MRVVLTFFFGDSTDDGCLDTTDTLLTFPILRFAARCAFVRTRLSEVVLFLPSLLLLSFF